MGPVSSLELKRLSAAGELVPDDLVWREGVTEWASCAERAADFSTPRRMKPRWLPPRLNLGQATRSKTPMSRRLKLVEAARPGPADILLDFAVGDVAAPLQLRSSSKSLRAFFAACGSYGLFVAAAVTAVLGVISAMQRLARWNTCFIGPSGFWRCWRLGMLAGKSCDAIEEVNRKVEGRLSSCASHQSPRRSWQRWQASRPLLGSVAVAIENSQYVVLLFGVGTFLVYTYMAVVALNPATLNIVIALSPFPAKRPLARSCS